MIRLKSNAKKKTAKKRTTKKKRARKNGQFSLQAIKRARSSLRKKSTRTRKRIRAQASGKAMPRKKKAAKVAKKRVRGAKKKAARAAKKKATPNRRRVRRNRLTTNRKRRTRRNAAATPNRKRRTRRNAAATPNRKRRSRRNPRHAMPNRRRRSARRNPRHTMNRRRRSHRRNPAAGLMALFKEAAITGLMITGGFFAHKVATNLLEENLIRSMLHPKVEPATAPAASGFGADDKRTTGEKYSKLVSGGIALVLGVGATGLTLGRTQPAVAVKLAAGMFASFLQQVVLTMLVETDNAQGIMYLSGLDRSSAARLSAMAGDIPRETIQPFYTPIGSIYQASAGMGEYFRNPAMGEYFTNPAMAGLGAMEAAAGLGLGASIYQASAGMGMSDTSKALFVHGGRLLNASRPRLDGYSGNPDIFQAVAGAPSRFVENRHVDPAGNLDHELSVMESMAGVGGHAGVGGLSIWNTEYGPMQTGEGMAFRDGVLGEFIEVGDQGNIQTVPSTQTWIPGESDGALWAGVRQVEGGMQTADTPAGIMQTIGGSGIFG